MFYNTSKEIFRAFHGNFAKSKRFIAKMEKLYVYKLIFKIKNVK